MGSILEEVVYLVQTEKNHSCPRDPVMFSLAIYRTEGGWVLKKFIHLIDKDMGVQKKSKFKIYLSTKIFVMNLMECNIFI